MYSILSFNQAARRTGANTEFFSLAATPHNETCTQAGKNHEDGIKECIALINQLKREHGEPPAGAEFFIIRNEHEFGTYFESGIFYTMDEEQEEDTESQEYAMKIETGIPDNWDWPALQELRDMQHSQYQPAKIIQLKRA